jgi:hypothetical protein
MAFSAGNLNLLLPLRSPEMAGWHGAVEMPTTTTYQLRRPTKQM